ncbi:MAG: type II secretion system protein GspL [Thiobacillus sp.]|nr:type II secretion system protein GspL [Thiobacillus sp.]MDP2979253.1 type II secretion system protein GspL [Thiobacillus sp.]
MSLLRIHIPSSWPDTEPDASLPWCRLGTRGERLDAGSATLADLPRAEACELVIPAEAVLLTRATLPRGSKRKMRQLLAYAIEDRLVAEPDTVHVAAGPTLGDGQTALAVVDKAWLARVRARLDGAGLRPRSAWPETLLPALPADGWVMVWGGRGGFLRSGEHAGMSLDGGTPTQPPTALVLSVAEARAAAALPHHLLLRLREGAPPPDVEAWSHVLGVAVEVGVGWMPLQHPDAAHGGIDLLQGAFASSGTGSGWPNLRLPLILAGLIALLQVGATATEWWLLSREKQHLQAAMEERFREAFPDARVIVDAPLQMQRNLAELRGTAGQMSPSDFMPLLSRVAPALDADSRGLRAIRYEASQLGLEVTVTDQAAAENLLKRLTDAGLACQLQSVSGTAPQSLARFTITGNTP